MSMRRGRSLVDSRDRGGEDGRLVDVDCGVRSRTYVDASNDEISSAGKCSAYGYNYITLVIRRTIVLQREFVQLSSRYPEIL